jgi:hypothetical protein
MCARPPSAVPAHAGYTRMLVEMNWIQPYAAITLTPRAIWQAALHDFNKDEQNTQDMVEPVFSI